MLPAALPAPFSATLSLAFSVYLCANVGPQGLPVVRLPDLLDPHSTSVGPATATRVLSAQMPVSIPPTGLDECFFFISLVSDFLAIRFSVSSGCARRRSVSTYAAILVLYIFCVFCRCLQNFISNYLPASHRPHLVMKAQGNTLDHVLHMTAGSANSGQFLSISPPLVNPEPLLFLSKETESYIDVIEVPLHGASGTLHNNCVSLQNEVDIFWNVDSLTAENGLHPHSRSGKMTGYLSSL